METVPAIRPPLRPACPRHPGSRVRLDGYVRCGWSDAHRRPRYRCVTEPGTRGPCRLVAGARSPAHRAPSGLGCCVSPAASTCPSATRACGPASTHVRPPGHRPPVPAPGRGHEPARGVEWAAPLGLPGPRRDDQPPGQPRRQLPRRLCSGSDRGAPPAGLAGRDGDRRDDAHDARVSAEPRGPDVSRSGSCRRDRPRAREQGRQP